MTTETLPDLTPRQREVLQWIDGFIDTHDYPPTLRQVAHAFGWGTSGAKCHTDVLARKNCLSSDRGQARTLRITPTGRAVLEVTP